MLIVSPLALLRQGITLVAVFRSTGLTGTCSSMGDASTLSKLDLCFASMKLTLLSAVRSLSIPEKCDPLFLGERLGLTPAPRELPPPARFIRARRVLSVRRGNDLDDLMDAKPGCRRGLVGGAVEDLRGGKMKRFASGLLRLSIAFCTDAPTSTRLIASAMEADTGDSAGDENEGTETRVSGVAGSDLIARPSSGMIVENLKPALFAVLGVGRNNSLAGLILVFNGGGGTRLLPGKGPGEEAVLLMPDGVSVVRFIWRGDAVRLPGLLYWLVADLFDVRRSSAAIPFAIGDDGLGGISDGNLACSCSSKPLFKASFCGGSNISNSCPDLLDTGDDSVYCLNSHDGRRLREVCFGRPSPPEADGE
jgi:hypothetical protein